MDKPKLSDKEGLMLTSFLCMVVANEGTDEERKVLADVMHTIPSALVNKYWDRVKLALDVSESARMVIDGLKKQEEQTDANTV